MCNLSGSDLVSIEEFKEWEFLAKAMQRLRSRWYFIGLRKDTRTGQWTWLSNGKSLNASRGEFPWADSRPRQWMNCVIVKKDYGKKIWRFENFWCDTEINNSGYICERAVACKDEKGRFMKQLTKEAFFCLFLVIP